MPIDERTPFAGLHARVLDALGGAICSGRLAAGAVLTLQDVEREHGVSRSVARESVRVLESLGLAASRRRLGIVILPRERWNALDARVIRWSIAGPEGEATALDLVELRLALEPEAARLAALRATDAETAALSDAAARLSEASGDAAAFLAADVALHTGVLAASGNPMFGQLARTVEETLVGWHENGLSPESPDPEAVARHVAVVAAIAARDADAAFARMRALLLATEAERRAASG